MGNTPSQGGFHHPEAIIAGNDTNIVSGLIQQSVEIRRATAEGAVEIPRYRNPMAMLSNNSSNSNSTTSLYKFHESGSSSSQSKDKTRIIRKSTDVLPDPPISAEQPETFSIDSLALEASHSIIKYEFSPSSLSPVSLQSHDPLGYITVSSGISSPKTKAKEVSIFPTSQNTMYCFDNIDLTEEYDEEKTFNSYPFDSLNEPIYNEKIVQSYPNSISAASSSSFGSLIQDPPKNIVTVNGLPVIHPGESLGSLEIIKKDGSSLDSQKISKTSSVTDEESLQIDQSQNPDNISQSSSNSSGFISEVDGIVNHKVVVQNINSIESDSRNDINNSNENEEKLVYNNNTTNEYISSSSMKCEVQQVQLFDFAEDETINRKNQTINNVIIINNLVDLESINSDIEQNDNVCLIKINSDPFYKHEIEDELFINEDSMGNFIEPSFEKCSQDITILDPCSAFTEESIYNNITNSRPNGSIEINPYDDIRNKVAISSLTFFDGINDDEDGEVCTQINLQSTDMSYEFIKQKVINELTMSSPIETNTTQQNKPLTLNESQNFSENGTGKWNEKESTNCASFMRENKGRGLLKDIIVSESLDEFEHLEAQVSLTEDFNYNSVPFKQSTNSRTKCRISPSKEKKKDFEDENTKVSFDELFVKQDPRKSPSPEMQFDSIETQRLLMHSSQDRELQEECITFHKEAGKDNYNIIENDRYRDKSTSSFSSETMYLPNDQIIDQPSQECANKNDNVCYTNMNESVRTNNLYEAEPISNQEITALNSSYEDNDITMDSNTSNIQIQPETVEKYHHPQYAKKEENPILNPISIFHNFETKENNKVRDGNYKNLLPEFDVSCINPIEGTDSNTLEKGQHISNIYVSTEETSLSENDKVPKPLVDYSQNINKAQKVSTIVLPQKDLKSIKNTDKRKASNNEAYFIPEALIETVETCKKVSKSPRRLCKREDTDRESRIASLSCVEIFENCKKSVVDDTVSIIETKIFDKSEFKVKDKFSSDLTDLLESKDQKPSKPVKSFEGKKQFLSIAHWGEISDQIKGHPSYDIEDIHSEEDLEIEHFENSLRESSLTGSYRQIDQGEMNFFKNKTVPVALGKSIHENSNNSGSSNECSLVVLPNNRKSTTDGIFQALKLRENRNSRLSNSKVSFSDENVGVPQRFPGQGSTKMTYNLSAGSQNEQFKLPGSSNDGLRQCNPSTISSAENNNIIFGKTFYSSTPLSSAELNLEEEGPRLSIIENTGTSVNIMSPSLSNNFMEMNGTDNHKDNEDSTANQEENFSRQLQEKENHINELQNNLEELKLKSNSESSYSRVLSEYEKTLSMYIQKVDELKEKLNISESEKRHLIQERDQALEDLRNVESAFSDVHRKYERSKGLLENLKVNEDTLLRRDQETTQKLQRRDKAIEALKEKAQESLEQMHLDYENKIKDYEAENVRLRAQFRKMEMKLDSLENDVEQKGRENAQLSALCDELINGQVVN